MFEAKEACSPGLMGKAGACSHSKWMCISSDMARRGYRSSNITSHPPKPCAKHQLPSQLLFLIALISLLLTQDRDAETSGPHFIFLSLFQPRGTAQKVQIGDVKHPREAGVSPKTITVMDPHGNPAWWGRHHQGTAQEPSRGGSPCWGKNPAHT